MWRWADSNRRPNNAPGGFLHAYPAFGFRTRYAGRRAYPGLIPWVLAEDRGVAPCIRSG